MLTIIIIMKDDFSRSKKKSFDWYKHVIETNGEEL